MRRALTSYQAKRSVLEMQRRYADERVGKLGGLLSDAQVELNPHQIDATFFVLHTPLLLGELVVDKVGPGKTIEAGMVVADYWEAPWHTSLIVAESSLRQQRQHDLHENLWGF